MTPTADAAVPTAAAAWSSAPTGLDAPVVELLTSYLGCEFATVTKAGVPIAWPAIPLVDAKAGTITLATSVGLAAKAYNVRREPRVSLLFSDPTGSGASSRPSVLVRGTAVCPDVVVTSPEGREDYWRRVYRCQPAGRLYGATPLTRYLFDWYYFRLFITVTPEQVEVRPPVQAPRPMTAPSRLPAGPLAQVAQELPRYRTAVLTWLDADGGPRSARVRATATAGSEVLRLDVAPGQPLRPGAASLLCHSHDERMWHLRSFVSTGELSETPQGWAFRPARFLPGAAPRLPVLIRSLRHTRAAANRYLAARGLERPQVPWADYRRLHQEAARS